MIWGGGDAVELVSLYSQFVPLLFVWSVLCHCTANFVSLFTQLILFQHLHTDFMSVCTQLILCDNTYSWLCVTVYTADFV